MPRLTPPRSKRVTVESPGEEIDRTDEVVVELSADDLDGLVIEPLEPAPQEPELPEEPDPDEVVRRAVEAQQRAEEIARSAQRERDDAIRRERDRQGELERERGDREDAEYNGVLTAIAAEQATLDKAEADYAAFLQTGEYTAAAKAQRIMTTAGARLDRLEDNKASFEQRRETLKTGPKPEPSPQQPGTVEQQIASMNLPENAKTWLRSHPELVSDQGQNARLGTVHRYLTEVKGVAQFSAAYFESLDAELGFKKPAAAAPAPDPAPQPQQRRSMPVTAPVSRDVPTASGQRQASSVTLSPEEVRVAHTSFTDPTGKMTNADKERLYALNKMKLARMRSNGEYPSRERA